jgi:hypothetical protein
MSGISKQLSQRDPLDALRAIGDNKNAGAQRIEITAIRRDGGTQPRAQIDQATVERYAEAMLNDQVLPAVVVFYDGLDYWLADGFHRVAAVEFIGRETIAAEVKSGDKRDAVLWSVGANAEHGLPRSNEDKRRAVIRLLEDPEWSAWSSREIARRCKVHHATVSRIRDEIEAVSVAKRQIPSATDDHYSPPPTRKVRRGNQVYDQAVSSGRRKRSTRKKETVAPVTYEALPGETAAPQRRRAIEYKVHDHADVDLLANQIREMLSSSDARYLVTIEVLS